MGKIVIVASKDDQSDLTEVRKILEDLGHTVEVDEPTPNFLTGMLLGLMSPLGYGFGRGYGYTPVPKDDKPEETEGTPEVPVPTDDNIASSDFGDFAIGESLGMVKIDGEIMEAFMLNAPASTMVVPFEIAGSRVSYQLNESVFAFWANDTTNLSQSVEITKDDITSTWDVKLSAGPVAKFLVGRDLSGMYK